MIPDEKVDESKAPPGAADPPSSWDPAVESSEPPEASSQRRSQLFLSLLVACLLGVSLTWICEERVGEPFHFSDRAVKLMTQQSPDFSLFNIEKPIVDARNLAVSNGIFGLILGTIMGIAGAMGGEASRVWRFGLLGLFAGGLAGALPGFVVVPLHKRWLDPNSMSLLMPIMTELSLWGIVVCVSGLVFGWGRASRSNALHGLFGALVGAAVAIVLLNLFYAVVFPLERTDSPLPATSQLRLWGLGFLGLGTAIGMYFQLRKANRPSEVPANRVRDVARA